MDAERDASPTEDSSAPDATDAALDAGPIGIGFVDVSAEMGFGDLVQWNETYPVTCHLDESADCRAMEISGGIAVRDVDLDGRPDVFLPRMEGRDLLLLNTPEGFVDRGEEFGIPNEITFSNAAAFADADNDGDPDLYVAGISMYASQFLEMVDGEFVESAAAWGVDLADGSRHTQMSACFGDIDLDGRLDLHTTEWRHSGAEPNHARLFINAGRSFEDVTEAWGVSMTHVGRAGLWSFTSNIVDLNNDRFPELIVAADFDSSRLFWNDDGVAYTDGTIEAGVGTDENGMGSTVGDIDGDGDLDWFVSAIFDDGAPGFESCEWGRSGNRLYRNDGRGEFTDITDAAGVRDGGWGWGARFFDYDLDGDLDLVLVNGTRSVCSGDAKYEADALRLWENDGQGIFQEVARARGLVSNGVARGVIPFDYDGDGDEDILISNSLDGPELWRNDVADGNAWLVVKPVGVRSNRDGYGAVVRVWPTEGSAPIVRHAGNGCGFLGHSPGVPRFGLNDLDVVHQVEVFWPIDKTRQRFNDVSTRQVFEVVEPEEAGF